MKPVDNNKFHLATLEQIAAMKVNVLFLRAKYRDYYDLYFLAKEVMGYGSKVLLSVANRLKRIQNG